MVVDLNKQVESVVTRNKAVEHQEVDHLRYDFRYLVASSRGQPFGGGQVRGHLGYDFRYLV